MSHCKKCGWTGTGKSLEILYSINGNRYRMAHRLAGSRVKFEGPSLCTACAACAMVKSLSTRTLQQWGETDAMRVALIYLEDKNKPPFQVFERIKADGLVSKKTRFDRVTFLGAMRRGLLMEGGSIL